MPDPDLEFFMALDLDGRFADLLTGPGCSIPATERRAISLDQLRLIGKHIIRRLTQDGEVWQVTRYPNGQKTQIDLTDPLQVNLYDARAEIIEPATKIREISLVEAMSREPQPPDFFTSQ